jgi:hypothetical protein
VLVIGAWAEAREKAVRDGSIKALKIIWSKVQGNGEKEEIMRIWMK